jgi:hypothetical protein
MLRPIIIFARPRRVHLVMLAFALLVILGIVIARTPMSAALSPSEFTTASAVTDLALPLIALPFTWALLVRN